MARALRKLATIISLIAAYIIFKGRLVIPKYVCNPPMPMPGCENAACEVACNKDGIHICKDSNTCCCSLQIVPGSEDELEYGPMDDEDSDLLTDESSYGGAGDEEGYPYGQGSGTAGPMAMAAYGYGNDNNVGEENDDSGPSYYVYSVGNNPVESQTSETYEGDCIPGDPTTNQACETACKGEGFRYGACNQQGQCVCYIKEIA